LAHVSVSAGYRPPLVFGLSFAVLFFVSVEMLFEPRILIDQPLHVLATMAVILAGQVGRGAGPGAAAAAALPAEDGFAGLGQPGADRRVLFLLAGLGMQLGLLPKEGQSLILAGAVISIAMNPLVLSGAAAAQRWLLQHPRIASGVAPSENPLASLPSATEEK
jgi:CPA2 family monovalent cation:H+ antiporter-2